MVIDVFTRPPGMVKKQAGQSGLFECALDSRGHGERSPGGGVLGIAAPDGLGFSDAVNGMYPTVNARGSLSFIHPTSAPMS